MSKSKKAKALVKIALIAGAFIIGIVFAAVIRLSAGLPSAEDIKNYQPAASTKILDCQGRFVVEFFQQRRTPVSLAQIPQNLKDAIMIIEDKRFYSHWGVDFIRIFGAAFHNIRTFNLRAQGASTITQQLARTMFLTLEKNMARKFKEMLLAFELERTYSKDEILELYLNMIYFGHGMHGVEAAAQAYFNMPVSELNLAQCALIAGLPRAQRFYSPYTNPQGALSRRNLVLRMMYKHEKISQQELDRAFQEPLGVQPKLSFRNEAPYFVEEIRKYLINQYGDEFVYTSGATIYATLDLDMQRSANQAVETQLSKIEADYKLANRKTHYDTLTITDSLVRPVYLQGALVAIDPQTGYVRAMVGGRDFSQSQFNRAMQARRQAGSAFKPFVYAAAIEQGYTPADLEEDMPLSIEIAGAPTYTPTNFDRKFLGNMTLRRALALSRNIIAVRLITKVSPQAVINIASSMGISSRLMPYYSLALGSCDVTLMDMASSFCVFANSGYRVKPILFTKVVDADGRVLEEHNIESELVVDPKVTYSVTHMLKSVVNEGTATAVRRLGFTYPCAGKTGTTDDYTDTWFMGYTPDLVCGVWIGYDQKKTIFRGATGGGISAPIWATFMNEIRPMLSGRDFSQPDSMIWVRVCDLTGYLATARCPKTREEVFILGREPRQECMFHMHGLPIYQFEQPDQEPIEGF
ncbi:MAG: PBP1A family penicillin-binding protein [Candidatus Latescibacteria bacterium]|nr:PBP1A family penicillin-binding protein [Candidatus Latescibacterota bacterium]